MKYVSNVRQVQHHPLDTSEQWLCLHLGNTKVNVGAFSRDGSRGAAVAFCGNERGEYISASALVINRISDVASLKALACREGISLAEDLNLSRVEIASDC